MNTTKSETVVLVTKSGGMMVGDATVKGFWFSRQDLIADAGRQVESLREQGILARLEVEE